MARLLALLASSLVASSSAIIQAELFAFIWGQSGLNTDRATADRLVKEHEAKINAGRVTLDQLKELKAVMSNKMGMSQQDILNTLFPAAEDGMDAQILLTFYEGLKNESGVAMEPKQAAETALMLAGIPVLPTGLNEMWNTVFVRAFGGSSLYRANAHRRLVNLMASAVDAALFSKYYEAYPFWMSMTEGLDFAASKGLSASLEARYSKNGRLWKQSAFEQTYKTSWLSEWVKAPLQKRVADNGKEYTVQQFKVIYGKDYADAWKRSSQGLQRKMGEDGKTYTLREFVEKYPGNWQTMFLNASIVADDCAGLTREACEKRPDLCTYGVAYDWTQACVVKSTMNAFFV